MELYGRSTGSSGSQSDRALEWAPVGPNTGPEGRLGLYPERPGLPDCSFYMRNGSCGYGLKCRYNHPRNRNSMGGVIRFGGVPLERPGEPDCQFYLRTGTCKFGASCKFHHPRYTNIRVNSNGYPLRPGEPECSYYLKTGQCKFGLACKFDHPQLNDGMSIMPLASARPFYPSVQTTSNVFLTNQYDGSMVSYRAGRPPPLMPPGSYMPPGTYRPVLVPPGVVPIPSWSTFSGPVSPAMSQNTHPTATTTVGSPYVVPSSAPSFAGPCHTFSPSSLGPSTTSQKGNIFPVRPGLPDCQFYLKTGDCKFGSVCRFNHPPDCGASMANCVFSPVGLPLRPGVQPCSFYMQNGYCKFGRMCKFDHPIGTMRYSPSASSLADVPVASYMVGSPLPTLAPSFSYIPGSKSESFTSRGTSSANTLIFSQTTGPAFLSNVHLSSQNPLTFSISTRPGGEVRQFRT